MAARKEVCGYPRRRARRQTDTMATRNVNRLDATDMGNSCHDLPAHPTHSKPEGKGGWTGWRAVRPGRQHLTACNQPQTSLHYTPRQRKHTTSKANTKKVQQRAKHGFPTVNIDKPARMRL